MAAPITNPFTASLPMSVAPVAAAVPLAVKAAFSPFGASSSAPITGVMRLIALTYKHNSFQYRLLSWYMHTICLLFICVDNGLLSWCMHTIYHLSVFLLQLAHLLGLLKVFPLLLLGLLEVFPLL
jgi:hypothetical protein